MTFKVPTFQRQLRRQICLVGVIVISWNSEACKCRAAPPENSIKSVCDNASQTTPNVLFLAVDDMKDWVGCLGGYEGQVLTPNIDRLAKRGTLFRNAHCPSPKCAPARAALFTGIGLSLIHLRPYLPPLRCNSLCL